MSVAGDFIIIDAEIARIKLRIRKQPADKALRERAHVLLKARDKLLLDSKRNGHARIANGNYPKD